MKELYEVQVTRRTVEVGVVEVRAESLDEARHAAGREANRRGFAWSEDSRIIDTGEVVVPGRKK